jgi:hypothetical protein
MSLAARTSPSSVLLWSLLSLAACGPQAWAQERAGEPRQGTPAARAVQRPERDEQRAARTAREAADETFDLDITERRITELNFFASTDVATGGAGALSLRVGVAVGAERIDVLLRNVRGRVRFRGSLEALRRVLDARRPAADAGRPTPTPP